jgi:hypothetical protein
MIGKQLKRFSAFSLAVSVLLTLAGFLPCNGRAG